MTTLLHGRVILTDTLENRTELSSRPERTRISYLATLANDHACGFP